MNLLDKNYIELTTSRKGVQVADSILWLDSMDTNCLSFISSAYHLPHANQKTLLTEDTAKLLQKIKHSASLLSCPYNRPFNIGSLKVELVPSGYLLGGASLYIELNQKSLFYVPEFQSRSIATCRKMQFKEADTLVIGAFKPVSKEPPPNRKKEFERFLTLVEHHCQKKHHPVIFCAPLGMAQELTKRLADKDLPVSLHSTMYKVNKGYELCGVDLGNYSSLNRRSSKNKIVVLPQKMQTSRFLEDFSTERPVICVGSKNCSELPGRPIDEFLIEDTSNSIAEIKNLIQKTKASKVYIYGPYAKATLEAVQSESDSIEAIYPNAQPTLF